MDDQRATIVRLLGEATSQDPVRMARAEEELRACETKYNHFAMLFDIFSTRSTTPRQTRWLAMINFKNGIDKYWKKADLYRIGLTEKQTIRKHLMDYFDEDDALIAVQYCLAVARIARWDFPRVWPEFADDLLACVRSIAQDTGDVRRRQRMELNVLYTMHLFVKTLCQRSLPLERQALRRITPTVFATVAPIYAERLAQLQLGLNAGHSVSSEDAQVLLKAIRMCLKTLRRLLVFGYAKIEDADAVAQDFYVASSSHQAVFYDLYKALTPEQRESLDAVPLRKIILIYGKMYMDFQNSHAVRFITTPGVQPMLAWYWAQIGAEAPKLVPALDSADAEPVVLEPLLIQGLTLHKNVVKNFFYAPDDSGHMDDEVKLCRHVIDTQIITPELVAQMAELLMRCYIPLKPRDLEMWHDDPEAWLADEGSDYWAFDVRRCAEHLFVDLVNQHHDQLAALLVAAISQDDDPADPSMAFYCREGRYAALGLCANDLYDAFDFCKWLKEHRFPESSPMDAAKWRIAWLIGRWVPIKFSVEERPHAYALLLDLTRPEEPLVVRIEALASLLHCIDDWDFDASQFSPFLALSFERIASVLSQVETADSRMRIVNFLSTLVQRMQREVVPFADAIVQMIPPLWQSAESENMYQTAILVLITKLVEALGVQATGLQDFIAPLIAHSIDLSTDAHVYLMEDGIELWLILLRNSTALSDPLLALSHRIPPLLENSTEMLKKILRLVESYFLLSAERVFQHCGTAILDALHTLVADTNLAARATLVGYNALSIIVQCTSLKLCAEPLKQSNILWTAFTRIIDKNDPALTLTYHSGFLSRIAVQFPSLFGEFLASQTPAHAATFCDNWVKIHDDLTQIPARRLHAFSLAVAIATTNDGILAVLPRMVPLWNDIISDTGSSALYYTEDSDYDSTSGQFDVVVAENQRRSTVLANDPVYKMDFRSVLTQSMAECERLNGSGRFQSVLANVHAEQLEMLRNQLC
ncbi:hypothetical protein IW140_002050 [Coemansia sp. RSA 1813]|nr:hypothetical protein EV178_000340 [Coemansia sp. RSA 1646]KAJ1773550.1 hypothetical protein LPJ74_000466 [Coemansia sp. RSA 1843]KAJ2090558.1 hypothetical protein IW138_002566 [Coemansia sp. RSA 986]KAJ2216354.1 hypothetical protein EV179_001379 [Coemansia sp. RSA 487]KAJ2570861.1 hypothetical protein IW140_002050 [Coemansia sp. RSA 1813]